MAVRQLAERISRDDREKLFRFIVENFSNLAMWLGEGH